MGQFAPVAPIQILEQMREQCVLGTYHLLLAHHVLEFPERFTALFDEWAQSTIFMDNSIVELGDAASDAKVKEACEVILAAKPLGSPNRQPHWVYPVLTDVMGNGEETRKESTTSYKWWEENGDFQRMWPMVVLQGDSWEEFTKTADYFLLNPDFGRLAYVGIPRVLVQHLGTRMRAVEYVNAIRPDINVHLLGFSDDVTDDILCSKHHSVEGIDSAVPIRYSHSVPGGLYTPASIIPPRPKDWFENGTFDKESFKNLQAMRQWVA